MKNNNSLLQFLAGLAMLAAGGYWFMSSVNVTTGFYSWRIGSFHAGGLVIVPFIMGVIWMFVNFDSFGAKLLSAVGLLIIIASVIMGTQFHFGSRSLYEYLCMLVLMFGGLGLLTKVYLQSLEEAMT